MATRPAGTPQVALNGVSYQEWLRRKRANPKLKSNTWRGYVSYVATKGYEKSAQRQAKAAQQFGQSYFQVDPTKYMKQFRSFLPQNPQYNPLTPAQLQQQARNAIMPMYTQQMDELTNAIRERSRLGSEAIQGYTNAYLGTLPQVQANMGAAWDEARNLQNAASQGFSSFVQGQGQAMTNQLAQMEQAAGQTSAGSTQVGNVAAGSSSATAAADWSTMSRLINQGAAAKGYAAQLPAIAGAYGADTMRAFQSDLNNELTSGLSELRMGAQGDIVSMYQSLLDRELQKAGLRDQRSQTIADAYADIIASNRDAQMAGAALQSQYGTTAQQAGIEYGAAVSGADQVPGQGAVDPATGKPVVPRGKQILNQWAEVRNDVANAIAQISQPVSPRPGIAGKRPSFEQLIRQAMAIVRMQMSGFNLTEGQIRGFARQALAANGITPTVKPKKKPPKQKPRNPRADPPGQVDPNAGMPPPGGGIITAPPIPDLGGILGW